MSKWDKLIRRIQNLSNDMRFAELKAVLEAYGYTMKAPVEEAVTVLSANPGKILLPSLHMNQLRKYMLRW